MPAYRRFKCYIGRSTTERKLRRLLKKYRFTTCYEVLRQYALVPAEPLPAKAEASQDARSGPGVLKEGGRSR